MITIMTPEFIRSMSTIPTKQWPWKGDKSQVTPKILVVVRENFLPKCPKYSASGKIFPAGFQVLNIYFHLVGVLWSSQFILATEK